MNELAVASQNNLSMIIDLVNKLDENDISTRLEILSSSSIGEHIRHVLEFYTCLFESENGEINYDTRRRNIELETSSDAINDVIKDIIKKLPDLSLDESVKVTGSYQEIETTPISISSTLGRELAHCLEHAIHHLAIVKMAVKAKFPHVILDDNFGVAYSTIRYRNELCAP